MFTRRSESKESGPETRTARPTKSLQEGEGGSFRRVRGLADETDEVTDTKPSSSMRRFADESKTDVMDIPDLDEEPEERIEVKVAKAPRTVTRRLPSLRELDAGAASLTSSSLTTVETAAWDLPLLAGCMVAPAMVEEEDEVWEFDSLMREVQQEMSMIGQVVEEKAKRERGETVIIPGVSDSSSSSSSNRGGGGERKTVMMSTGIGGVGGSESSSSTSADGSSVGRQRARGLLSSVQ